MVRPRAIRRAFDEAGSVNALLALWAFVADGTFVTKAGDVGVVYRLQGQDYEVADGRRCGWHPRDHSLYWEPRSSATAERCCVECRSAHPKHRAAPHVSATPRGS